MSRRFHERRRQQFMTEGFYNAKIANLDSITPELRSLLTGPEKDLDKKRSWAFYLSDDAYERLSLRYTAGDPIEPLRAELGEVVTAYENYRAALIDYEKIPSIAPLGLGNIGDYERCMQLIGLCYLLHRRDLLPRIAALEDPAYVGEDALYEDLLAYELEGRLDVDEWYHDEPYSPLIRCMYDEDPAQAQVRLGEYVDNWYRCFKYVPWHDGHLRIKGTDGDYFGYWAFEAGAVALLCDIDDSAVDHMVYPRDLVAWARAHKHLSEEVERTAGGATRLRCEGGQPCPREGWWFTPAQADSRRRFAAGDSMPSLGGDYGATIWQWDDHQEH